VITAFLGRLSCYPCHNDPEGNTLAATDFCQTPRVLGICYSKTIQRETENRQYFGPTVEFNSLTRNVTSI